MEKLYILETWQNFLTVKINWTFRGYFTFPDDFLRELALCIFPALNAHCLFCISLLGKTWVMAYVFVFDFNWLYIINLLRFCRSAKSMLNLMFSQSLAMTDNQFIILCLLNVLFRMLPAKVLCFA